MNTTLQDLYRDDLRFLLRLKKAVGLLHNRIHDNLARMAIEHFQVEHPQLSFTYTNAGASGIDILGLDAEEKIALIAEVKTTLPDLAGRIRGPQTHNIKKDLDRLKSYEGDVVRYLVLISAETVQAVKNQLNTEIEFPNIKLLNALDDELREVCDSVD